MRDVTENGVTVERGANVVLLRAVPKPVSARVASQADPVRRYEIVGPDGEPDAIDCTGAEWVALQCHCRRYGELLEPHHPSEHERYAIERAELVTALAVKLAPQAVPVQTSGETFDAWALRHLAWREKQGVQTKAEESD